MHMEHSVADTERVWAVSYTTEQLCISVHRLETCIEQGASLLSTSVQDATSATIAKEDYAVLHSHGAAQLQAIS